MANWQLDDKLEKLFVCNGFWDFYQSKKGNIYIYFFKRKEKPFNGSLSTARSVIKQQKTKVLE